MKQGQAPELDSRPQGRREWSGWLTSLVLPIGFVVALVGVLIVLQSRGGDGAESPYGSVELPASLNVTGQSPRAEAGRAAPDFVLETASGPLVHLSDLQGRPVIVSFFTTWCSGCRAQMPLLVGASAQSGRDLVVLAVNLQEAPEPVAEFLSGYDAGFEVLFDRDGDVAGTWRVGGPGQPLPATFFIDSTGVIRKVVGGAVTQADISEGVRLIAGGGN